jgi:hypothetical protein
MNKLSPLLLPFWGEIFIFIKLFGFLPHASWWWLVWFFATDQSIFYLMRQVHTTKIKTKAKAKPVADVIY